MTLLEMLKTFSSWIKSSNNRWVQTNSKVKLQKSQPLEWVLTNYSFFPVIEWRWKSRLCKTQSYNRLMPKRRVIRKQKPAKRPSLKQDREIINKILKYKLAHSMSTTTNRNRSKIPDKTQREIHSNHFSSQTTINK